MLLEETQTKKTHSEVLQETAPTVFWGMITPMGGEVIGD
jgi:hypothetical protein